MSTRLGPGDPGAQVTCLPGCSAELGLQGPVWLWAFVSGGQGEQGVQSEEGMCAQCHTLKSHYLRIFEQSGPDICLANPFF